MQQLHTVTPFLPELTVWASSAQALADHWETLLIPPDPSASGLARAPCICGTLVTAELIVRARMDARLRRRLQRFDLNFLVDGRVGQLTRLRHWLGRGPSALPQVPVHSTRSLLESLALRLESTGQGLACVGPSSALLSLLASQVQKRWPTLHFLTVPVASELWGVENDRPLRQLRAQTPAVVLVALGTPLQEEWIQAHADLLPSRLVLGVGELDALLAELSGSG